MWTNTSSSEAVFTGTHDIHGSRAVVATAGATTNCSECSLSHTPQLSLSFEPFSLQTYFRVQYFGQVALFSGCNNSSGVLESCCGGFASAPFDINMISTAVGVLGSIASATKYPLLSLGSLPDQKKRRLGLDCDRTAFYRSFVAPASVPRSPHAMIHMVGYHDTP